MNKKGVSPVIATLLLIVIAVAAAVVTYTFVMGFVGTSTTTPPITTERIIVEAVEVNTTDQNVTYVYVRNVGSTTVNVSAIYLVRSDGIIVGNNTNVNATISPGELKQIPANIKYTDAKPNELYYVKVVTTGGVMASSSQFKLK